MNKKQLIFTVTASLSAYFGGTYLLIYLMAHLMYANAQEWFITQRIESTYLMFHISVGTFFVILVSVFAGLWVAGIVYSWLGDSRKPVEVSCPPEFSENEFGGAEK